MTLTAVFTSAPESGYTATIEEIPGAISEGESLDEAWGELGGRLADDPGMQPRNRAPARTGARRPHGQKSCRVGCLQGAGDP